SVFGRDPTKATVSVVSTAILYSIFGVTSGVVQAKFRESKMREWDAREAASNEVKQRRIAEAELWTSEEMRRLIVDSSVDAIIGIGEDGSITMWNPNAEKLFGCTQTEAMGHPVEDRIVQPDAQEQVH